MKGRLAVALIVLVIAGLTWGPAPRAVAAPTVEGSTADWVQVSAGAAHTCGIRTSGRLYCWGSNVRGGLGAGTQTYRSTPLQVGRASNWTEVSAGDYHTCALRSTGRLYCWGDDRYGQMGNGGGLVDSARPVEVFGGTTDWTSVSAGGGHTCALKRSGRLFCWGLDRRGQLGNGAPFQRSTVPVVVAGGITNWAAVSVNGGHTCARRSTGRLYCWGDDEWGSLGDDEPSAHRPSPVQVLGGATDWAFVASGYYHSCAGKTDGQLFCWGGDWEGALGDGGPIAYTTRGVPAVVVSDEDAWTGVDGGYFTTCGVRASGRLFCWGDDYYGSVGNGNPEISESVPVEVFGGATTWQTVTSGLHHACGIRAPGRLFCWGIDSSGELGNGGPNADSTFPVQVH